MNRSITIRDNKVVFSMGFDLPEGKVSKELAREKLKLFYVQALAVIEGKNEV